VISPKCKNSSNKLSWQALDAGLKITRGRITSYARCLGSIGSRKERERGFNPLHVVCGNKSNLL